MAWSSYAHLPNSEEEYYGIMTRLESEMTINEVDAIIALVKNKEKVQHHYRSNLSKLGLFDIISGKIYLTYNVNKLKKDKRYIKKILSDCVRENGNGEISIIRNIIIQKQTYDTIEMAESLHEMNPEIDIKNFIRWIRPIINLLRIIDVLSLSCLDYLAENTIDFQKAYLKCSSKFGEAVALELIDKELKSINNKINLIDVLYMILNNIKLRFKIELLMLPNWATNSKPYIINKEYYSHVKIKSDLLEES